MRSRLFLVAVACTTSTLMLASPAYAGSHTKVKGGGGSPPPTVFDISYPQCNGSFPGGAGSGIVGVNDGIVYKANPCLGTGDGPSELKWAIGTGSPVFYANTGDPGPAYSSHWPSGISIDGHQCLGDNSSDCSWVYGYQAAANSFADAVTAESQLGAANASAAAAAVPWWLDVETGNSWQTLESAYSGSTAAATNDVADVSGAVAALSDRGVGVVGFYSTTYQWTKITGGTGSTFATSPAWLAGYTNSTDATAACTSVSFTGGPVKLTQYQYGGYDADHAC